MTARASPPSTNESSGERQERTHYENACAMRTLARPRAADRPSGGSPAIIEAIEWLTGDECHELDDAGLVAGLGRRLRTAGLPLDRLTLHLRTLHPELLARTVAWAPGEPVEIHDREHGIEVSAAFAGSALREVM